MSGTLVPKKLGDPAVRQARLAMLWLEHVAPLTEFVERIRRDRGLGAEVPCFDPLDAGLYARCLVVNEAPGPQAVASGFISRDNPDESARNTLLLHAEAGLSRQLVAIWNIVPWYIGDGARIRAANAEDIRAGMPYLLEVIGMLPRLQAVLLAGRKAQRAAPAIRSRFPALAIFDAPHTSPLVVNTRPENRQMILERLRAVAAFLGHDHEPRPISTVPRVKAPASTPRRTVSSRYAGMRIVRSREYQAGGNPRRPGSHGYSAYELIPLGDRGIRFEDLLAAIRKLPAKSSPTYGAGGTNHIKWDLDHGFTHLIPDG